MLVLVGGLVCVGWLTRTVALVQLRPGWAAMKFNAALGFIVLGVGLALAVRRVRFSSLICAIAVVGLGTVSAVQDLLHIPLQVDELFMTTYIVDPGAAPGRMSPIAALLFVMSGTGLALANLPRVRATVVGLLASASAGLSASALIGYLTQTPIAYGWGAARIAVHACGLFIVAAVALGALATRDDERLLPHWAPWAGLISGIACTTALAAALGHGGSGAASAAASAWMLALAIGGALSVLMAWALHSRRSLIAQRDLLADALARGERALADSARAEQLVRSTLEAAPDAMLITDSGGRIVRTNRMTEQLFGYRRSELIGEPIEMLMPGEIRSAHAKYRDKFAAAPVARFMGGGRELLGRRKDGSMVPVEIALSPVTLPDGSYAIAAVRDITMRRETEDKLRESLEEKVLLLREIHHRVKNNLQVVASMLALQADKADHPLVREPLEDCRQRVMSMALVHEKLYGAGDLRRIDLSELTREIATMLMGEDLGPVIETRFDVEPIAIDIERAVPASLILNELMTNCLKHAYKGRDRGQLSVTVKRCGESRICLEVADDGIGGLDLERFRKGRTLGVTIVRNLVRQLDAQLSVASGAGTKVAISFPIGEGQNR